MTELKKILLFVFITTASTLFAEYTITVNDYSNNGLCMADIFITVDGNAGPYDVGVYYSDYPDVPLQLYPNISSSTTLLYKMKIHRSAIVRITDKLILEQL